MLREGAQRAVPGNLLQHWQRAAVVLQLADAGVAELVQGPSGGAGEGLGGPPVGQAGAPGGRVPVGGSYRGAGAAAGEENRPAVPA